MVELVNINRFLRGKLAIGPNLEVVERGGAKAHPTEMI
jgi:hypothetical protein